MLTRKELENRGYRVMQMTAYRKKGNYFAVYEQVADNLYKFKHAIKIKSMTPESKLETRVRG